MEAFSSAGFGALSAKLSLLPLFDVSHSWTHCQLAVIQGSYKYYQIPPQVPLVGPYHWLRNTGLKSLTVCGQQH